MGRVSDDVTTTLSDYSIAGVGDLVQARQNNQKLKDHGGREVNNRDVFRVDSIGEDGALSVRRRLEADRFGKPFDLPGGYVSANVTLAYCDTGHSAEGKTVERCFPIIDPSMGREALYVAMTRAKAMNKGFVITEPAHAHQLKEADELERSALSVLREVMGRSDAELSATETIARSFDDTWGLQRTGAIWLDVASQLREAENRQLLVEAVGSDIAALVVADEAAPAFWMVVGEARDQGYDLKTILPELVAERELHTAESIAQVLHWRVQRHMETSAPDLAAGMERRETYIARTPVGDTPLHCHARQVAEHNDRRVTYLGDRAAEEAPLHLVAHIGPVPDAPVERVGWSGRAGLIEAYREQHGAPSPLEELDDPIGRPPSKAYQPERYHSWRLANDALGRPDRTRDVTRLSDDDLRGRLAAWAHAKADAPEWVRDALVDARKTLARAEFAFERAAAINGKGSAHAQRVKEQVVTAEALAKKLEVDDRARISWWQGAQRIAHNAEEASVA